MDLIIESINKYLKSFGSKHLVLHRSILPSSTFKAYKKFCYTLWLIEGKERHSVFTFEDTRRVTSDTEEKAKESFEQEFLTELIRHCIEKLNLKDIQWSKMYR